VKTLGFAEAKAVVAYVVLNGPWRRNEIRRRVCEKSAGLGLGIDEAANQACGRRQEYLHA
jgi:hypothetical protein